VVACLVEVNKKSDLTRGVASCGSDLIRGQLLYSQIVSSCTDTKSLMDLLNLEIMVCAYLWCLTPLSTIFQLYRSWQSVLLVEENGKPGENHRPVASHGQTLSHNVVLSTPQHVEIMMTATNQLEYIYVF